MARFRFAWTPPDAHLQKAPSPSAALAAGRPPALFTACSTTRRHSLTRPISPLSHCDSAYPPLFDYQPVLANPYSPLTKPAPPSPGAARSKTSGQFSSLPGFINFAAIRPSLLPWLLPAAKPMKPLSETHACALHRAVFRRSGAPWQPNGAGTDASAGRFQDPGGPPSAPCSYAHPATAIPCSSSLEVCPGLRASRRSPSPLYMHRSVSLVGLARRGVIPQNNSTSKCSFMAQ
jgi:hypothetical protein